MSTKKPTPGGRAKKKAEVSLVRFSAAEYLTFVAAIGDSEASVEMRYEDENIWLTQKMMAELYGVSVPAINQHLKRIFSDNELDEAAVVKSYLITASDGKNYLSDFELGQMQRIVSAYLDMAEMQAMRKIPMTMEDWEKRLSGFLQLWDREILQDAGRVTEKLAKAHAESEFEKYRIVQDRLFESDFDRIIKQLPEKKNEP
jgi:hypothetical protein